jgi:hypothetical protein
MVWPGTTTCGRSLRWKTITFVDRSGATLPARELDNPAPIQVVVNDPVGRSSVARAIMAVIQRGASAEVDDGGDRSSAGGSLMHRRHRDEHRRVAGDRRGHSTNTGLDLPVPVDV